MFALPNELSPPGNGFPPKSCQLIPERPIEFLFDCRFDARQLLPGQPGLDGGLIGERRHLSIKVPQRRPVQRRAHCSLWKLARLHAAAECICECLPSGPMPKLDHEPPEIPRISMLRANRVMLKDR